MAPGTDLSPLVGRADDLQQIADAIGLGAEPGGAVLLGGDAGVGKSRLLTELRTRALSEGWRVLLGHCVDFGDSALPYLPFSEAFGRLAAESTGAAKSLVEGSSAIARLLPARRTLGERDDETAPIDRAALFEAVHRTLDELANDVPLLLVVEDVHWADVSTRELLTYLLTRRSDGPVAIVVSYRSDDLNRRHPLRVTLAEWHRLPALTRLHVEGLGERDLRLLVGALRSGALPERDMQRIVQRAEGNPFFAEELVSAAGDTPCSLPTELADLLLVRLERLDRDGRLAVRAASVAGRRVPHDLLARVSGLQADDLDLALRAAVEANVLLPVGGDGYMFRHALLAEAVYDDLLPGERVRLHAAYAHALSARDAPGTAAELARHARAAHDLVTAARASVRAGDEAMVVGGPDEAAHHYELALELLADPEVAVAVSSGDGSAIDQIELALRAVGAAVSAGHIFRALALAQDQLQALPADTAPAKRAQVLSAVANTALLTDTRIDVLALTTEAIALTHSGTDALRAQLLTVHARANAERARDDEAARWATEAQTLARRLGRLDIAADAGTTLARIDKRAGDPDGSRLALGEAVAEAQASGDVAAELRSLFNLGGLDYELGRLQEALEIYQQTWKRAQQAGLPWGPYGLESRAMTAIVAHVSGDWQFASDAVDVTGENPPELAEALIAALALEVAAGYGQTAALAGVDRLRSWWQRDGLIAILSGGAAIDLYGHAGDLVASQQAHDAVVAGVSSLWHGATWQGRIRLNTLLLGHIASALPRSAGPERTELAQRGEEVAADTAEVAADVTVRGRQRGPEAEAWLARAAAEHARLRWLAGADPVPPRDLVDSWRSAVSAFDKFGHVYETARSRARLAAVLRATGDAAAAARELALAREVAVRLGAEPLLAEIRSQGSRSGPARAAGASRYDEPLTPREEEVLALVAQGRSNGEIARHLFISSKTVSVHVSNMMAKLGAASRTEAVAVARRQGVLDDEVLDERRSQT